MMSLREYSSSLPPLTGGMNYNRVLLAVEKDEAHRIENCHIDGKGIAFTRGGSRKINSTAMSAPIRNIHQFVRPYGAGVTREILVVGGNTWYSVNTSTGVATVIATLSGSSKPSVVTFQDGSHNSIAILANGEDFIKYTGTGSGSDLLAADSDFPGSQVPRVLEVYDNRLIGTGCDTYPYRVYHSTEYDPTTWQYYFSAEEDGDRERIIGLGKLSKFLVFLKNNIIYTIDEGDSQSTTVSQIPIATGYGTSCADSVVSWGDYIFFGDQSGYYMGRLRAAVENGLVVEKISGNVDRYWEKIGDYSNIHAEVDVINEEIIIGCYCSQGGDNHDTGLVFNLRLSDLTTMGGRKVWSGVFKGDGYEPLVLGKARNSDGVEEIWRGDSSGYVYVMDEEFNFKDDSDDIRSRIDLSVFMPGGIGRKKFFLKIYPYLYQNHNESTKIYYQIDESFLDSSDGVIVEADGNIPYWSDSLTSDRRQTWDGTVWADSPILPIKNGISIMRKGSFIIFIIDNLGANDYDEIAYAGAEVSYQYRERV